MSGLEPALLARHVVRMRTATVIALVATVATAAAGYVLSRRSSAVLSPLGVTVLVVAGALWLAFRAEGDARRRLDRVKRAYAVQGDVARLLRGHLGVYLVVLLRLLLVAAAGLVVAVWGLGPGVALGTHALALVLIALTWPTRRKTVLLVERAQAGRAT